MHILILHGVQSHAGDHWQRWLKQELEERKHTVYMPELPNTEHPDRFDWQYFIKHVLSGVPLNELIIVGHSLGVVSALDFIEQSENKVYCLVSVSGFAEDYGAELNGSFMRQRDIDFIKVKKHLSKAVVIYGDDDPYVPQEKLENLANLLGVKPIVIVKGGHLNTDAGYVTFPMLTDVMKQLDKKKK